jgi:acyl carrier protein
VESSAAELKDHLVRSLPMYMIPSAFVHLEALPLSPNGKIDRLALPTPEQMEAPRADSPRPIGRLEETISKVWEEVLNRQVAPGDNFFDLGGDSLQLIEVHSELQKTLAREISLMDLFEFTTVRTLADHLGDALRPDEPTLSVAQERARKQKVAFARQRPKKVGS